MTSWGSSLSVTVISERDHNWQALKGCKIKTLYLGGKLQCTVPELKLQ